MTARRGERAGVVWLNGVIGWGLSASLLWCAVMWLARSGADLAEQIIVALMLFPAAGYVAGRMMWYDRLHAERGENQLSLHADAPAAPCPPAATSPDLTQELAPTWSRVVQVWWALTWRSAAAMFASLLVGTLLGAVAGVIFHAAGSSAQISRGFTQLLGAGLGLAVSIVPVKLIIGKNFGEFRLVLLAPRPKPRETGHSGAFMPTQDSGTEQTAGVPCTQTEPNQ